MRLCRNSSLTSGSAVGEDRCLGHEPRHFVFDLGMRFQADIEIEDDLVEIGGLDLLQGQSDPRRRAHQNRILSRILRPRIARPLNHADGIAIAGRREWDDATAGPSPPGPDVCASCAATFVSTRSGQDNTPSVLKWCSPIQAEWRPTASA